MSAKPGYIIMLTLLIIAVAVALITAIVRQSFTFQRSAVLARDETHARLLALSSLEIAAAKLSLIIEKEKEAPKNLPASKNQKKETLEPLQQWVLKILPQINKWQNFDINEGAEGGTIKLYLAAEQGKIPLSAFQKELMENSQQGEGGTQPGQPESAGAPSGNQPTGASQGAQARPGQNSEKQQLQNNQRAQQAQGSLLKAVDELFVKEKSVSLKTALIKLVSDLQRMPDDATELMRISQFAPLKESLFVNPYAEKKDIFLMDMLTAAGEKGKINPWLLSSSAKKLLGISEGKEQKTPEDLVKKLKPRMQWAREWDDVLAPHYGKKYHTLPKDIAALFADEFEATAFSVVSYSTVGTVTQKLYALLELTEPDKNLDPKSMIFKVTKLYWLS